MFRVTKTTRFFSLDYSLEISEAIEDVFRDCNTAVILLLIRRLLDLDNGQLTGNTTRFLEILRDRCITHVASEDVAIANEYIKSFDITIIIQLLETYLSFWLKDLSTEVENPLLRKKESEEKENLQTEIQPTLKDVIEAYDVDTLLTPSLTHTSDVNVYYDRTLFHSILAVRDRLIATGHCDTWSDKHAQSWVENSREFLRNDIAIQAANIAVTEYGEEFISEVLREIVESIGSDMVFYTRLGKNLDESNTVIPKLLAGVKERIHTVEINPTYVSELARTVKLKDLAGIKECIRNFVKSVLDAVITLIEAVIKIEVINPKYLPDKESPLPFPDKHSDEALLRLSATFLAKQIENVDKTLRSLLHLAIADGNSQWMDHIRIPNTWGEWLIAVPLHRIQLDSQLNLGDVVIVPSDKCPELVQTYFSNISVDTRLIQNPLDERVWAFVDRISANANDPERAKWEGRRKIEESLNSILMLVDNRGLYDYQLGSRTYVSNKNTHTATVFNGIGLEVKYPLDLTGDKFPVGTPWGDYLRATKMMNSPVSNRVNRAINTIASARRYELPEQRFVQYLLCLETLLVEDRDSAQFSWLDRAAIIMAGPNVPESGFTYQQARIWLRDDLDTYCELRNALLQGRGVVAIERVMDRLESIVVGCLLNVYALLSNPDFSEIDQLVLWFSAIRPQDAAIGGVVS